MSQLVSPVKMRQGASEPVLETTCRSAIQNEHWAGIERKPCAVPLCCAALRVKVEIEASRDGDGRLQGPTSHPIHHFQRAPPGIHPTLGVITPESHRPWESV